MEGVDRSADRVEDAFRSTVHIKTGGGGVGLAGGVGEGNGEVPPLVVADGGGTAHVSTPRVEVEGTGANGEEPMGAGLSPACDSGLSVRGFDPRGDGARAEPRTPGIR